VVKLAGDTPGPQGIRPKHDSRLHKNELGSFVFWPRFSGRRKKLAFKRAFSGKPLPAHPLTFGNAGRQSPRALPTSANAVSYRETQHHLPGVYALGMQSQSLLAKGSDEDRKNMMDAPRGEARHALSDAFNSLTGELGYLQTVLFDFGKKHFSSACVTGKMR